MILTDHTIRESISNGTIVIQPFVESNLGTNSYDVRLGKTLALYKDCLLYTSPSPRDATLSRMPSSA